MYDVEEAQCDFLMVMIFIFLIDSVMTFIFVKRYITLKNQLRLKKELEGTPERVEKTKGKKKTKKCKKRVEETKEAVLQREDIEAHQAEPVIKDECLNSSIQSEESHTEFIKKTAVAQAPEVPTHVVSQMPQQQYVQGYPQTLQIGDRTYIAVRVSEFQNLQRIPPQVLYMRNGHGNF